MSYSKICEGYDLLLLDSLEPPVVQGLCTVSRRLVLDDGVYGVVAHCVLAGHLVISDAAVLKPVTPDDVLSQRLLLLVSD